MNPQDSAEAPSKAGSLDGIWQGVGAYLIWGVLPLVFHLLASVDPFAIVGWRIVMSLIVLVPVLVFRGTFRNFIVLLGSRGAWPLVASGICIMINWCVYVWGVNNGHVLATSLGYFLNPLVNVLLGWLVLKERLNRVQMFAVAMAAMAVAILAVDAWRTLWISLGLAFSFGLYGLIRKMAAAPPMQGLAAETLFLLPVGAAILAYQAAQGSVAFDQGPGIAALLMAMGVITTVPLLLFTAAARRLTLTMLGLLQYLAPTMQFFLGILFFGENLVPSQLWSFVLIWGALAIFTFDAVRTRRALALAESGG